MCLLSLVTFLEITGCIFGPGLKHEMFQPQSDNIGLVSQKVHVIQNVLVNSECKCDSVY